MGKQQLIFRGNRQFYILLLHGFSLSNIIKYYLYYTSCEFFSLILWPWFTNKDSGVTCEPITSLVLIIHKGKTCWRSAWDHDLSEMPEFKLKTFPNSAFIISRFLELQHLQESFQFCSSEDWPGIMTIRPLVSFACVICD